MTRVMTLQHGACFPDRGSLEQAHACHDPCFFQQPAKQVMSSLIYNNMTAMLNMSGKT